VKDFQTGIVAYSIAGPVTEAAIKLNLDTIRKISRGRIRNKTISVLSIAPQHNNIRLSLLVIEKTIFSLLF
jgi:hypothetical protein